MTQLKLRILSLNIGLPRTEPLGGKKIITGICKLPVTGPVYLDTLGFNGDSSADKKNHGGIDKAVCVYGLNRYSYWEEFFKERFSIPTFGENFTIENLDEEKINIGDIFNVGDARVQVTQPRQPCSKLALKMGKKEIIKLVTQSGFSGFYFRVLKPGLVSVKDNLVLEQKDKAQISLSFANRILHQKKDDLTSIKKILAVPALSASWRESFTKLLNLNHQEDAEE